jgi:hypothetical protein
MSALATAKAAVRGNAEWEDLAAHIDRAEASQTDPPVQLPRTLAEADATLGRADYREKLGPLQRLQDANVHIGQRKLALSLIDFLTRSKGTGDAFVVYPGASIIACLAALQPFPKALFLCFDPVFASTVTNARRELGRSADAQMRKVAVVRKPRADADDATAAFAKGASVVVFTDDAGMYGDDSHVLARAVFANVRKGHELVFASDVRRSSPGGRRPPTELQIAEEMAAQARWVKSIGARAWTLKLRFPFLDASGALAPDVARVYAKSARDLGSTITAEYGEPGGDSPKVTYLDGEACLQAYGREGTTELRLIGTKGFALRRWDIRSIERIMTPFNAVHRSHTRFVAGDDDFAELVDSTLTPRGRRGTFDALLEACILRDAPTSTDLRERIEAFSSLFAADRQPRTGGGGPETRVSTTQAALAVITLTLGVLGGVRIEV